MHLLLETIVLLLAFNTLTVADVTSGWRPRSMDLDDAADEAHDAELLKAVQESVAEWKRKRSHSRYKRSQPNSVCYEQLGCFEDSGPFGYLEMLPSPPQEINTRFLLYSTKSRGDIPLLDVPFGNMSMAYFWADRAFNSSSPTKVIVHGFGSNCDHVWVYEMRSALMAVEECNVICVDWEAGALIPNYVRAAANTRLVGKQLAMLLEGLANHINLKFENVHLIGFSLGAHVAGFAGSQLKNISRITGLDPAGPLFEAQDPRARLDSNDAKFVDVIHSNGENLILGGLGSWQPMGHVDFYPNGGRMQTGCSNLFVGAVTDIIWSSAVEGRSLCNHRRAYKFFTDSVSPKCHFPSFPCNSYDEFLAGNCFGCNGDARCGNMGYYADRSTGRGQLYLLTRDEEPFCAHQYHVQIQSSKNNQSLVSYGKIMLELIGDSGLNETFLMTRKDDSELTSGSTISRMLVPHPALGVPVKIQLQYQAYSGWLSSGLNQWTIDKVVLSDSFGKTSSSCMKGLVMPSGISIPLTLYPGNCENIDDSENKNKTVDKRENENNSNENKSNKPTFIPTQVVQIGDELIQKNKDSVSSSSTKRKDIISLIDKSVNRKSSQLKSNPKKSYASSEVLDITDAFNLPWQPLSNNLDNSPSEQESGRAFGSINTKFHSFSFLDTASNQTTSEIISEIVEPILKVPATKNARSHDIGKVKSEITEPILGSTTAKVDTMKSTEQMRPNRTPKTFEDTTVGESSNVERSINVSDEEKWKPTYNLLTSDAKSDNWENAESNNTKESTEKTDTFSLFQWQNKDKKETSDDGNNSISSFTVQFLPTRLVSFLEKAERYARTTILPLVSAYTPKFLFFGQDSEPQKLQSKKSDITFVPLNEKLINTNDTVPKQTQQEKIEIIKNIQPPNNTDDSNEITKRNNKITPSNVPTISNNPLITNIVDNYQYSASDPIKIVKPPEFTTTTLAPVIKMIADSSEKVIIVYPSNAREDRKIQSHSYPEIMQFETLYQQSMNQPEESRMNARIDTTQFNKNVPRKVHVELPTYEPPIITTPFPLRKIYSSTRKFIPVSFPSN